ncbi:MAG: ATP-binding protein [Oscillospiraceae bacterium]|nr:ATP-binding protein [Oscillospiraceae bacterium]
MHHITIKNFGPIEYFDSDINQFTVLTGPQAGGKSTIAKAIYFFRTIKDEIRDLILKNIAPPLQDILPFSGSVFSYIIDKFNNLFGRHIHADDFSLEYKYSDETYIKIYPSSNKYHSLKVSTNLNILLETYNKTGFTADDISTKLSALFQDDTKTVYILAGRSITSVLSSQMAYMFISMDDKEKSLIDYSMLKYIELTRRIMAWFEKETPVLSDRNYLNKKIAEYYEKIIKGNYMVKNSQEYISINDGQLIPINFSSSGQQEAVWILNFLNYYTVDEPKKIFLIVEEPESHLYPESQMYMTDALSLFINGGGNSGLITTHSPYILGELNNLILCGQTAEKVGDENKVENETGIYKQTWIKKDTLLAFYIDNSKDKKAMTKSGLIKDELIDGASYEINRRSDKLIELYHENDEDEENE